MKALVALLLTSLLTLAAARAGLVEIENQFRAAYEQNVGSKYSAAVAELDGK
jgi:hypothetical protein